jgi:hypothetical protein
MEINEEVFYSEFCSGAEKNRIFALLRDLEQKAVSTETEQIKFYNEFANEEHSGDKLTIKTSDGHTYLYIEDTYLDDPYSIKRIA